MPKKNHHAPMTNAAWKQCIIGFLDGVERDLHADAPAEDKVALQALRSRLEKKRITEARKPYERKIDALIDSRPYLFAAAHRHLGKVVPVAVERAAASLKKARDLLGRVPNKSLQPTATARSASDET